MLVNSIDPNNFENLVKELDFISSIPKNNKPCYITKTFIHKKAWFATARRRWKGEKGEHGIVHVNNILSSCDKYYRMCLSVNNNNDDHENKLRELLLKLKNTVIGFENLIETYNDQKSVSDDYKKCKERVESLYTEIGNYFDKKEKALIANKLKENEIKEEEIEGDEIREEENEYNEDIWFFNNEFMDDQKKALIMSLIISGDSPRKSTKFFTNENLAFVKYNRD